MPELTDWTRLTRVWRLAHCRLGGLAPSRLSGIGHARTVNSGQSGQFWPIVPLLESQFLNISQLAIGTLFLPFWPFLGHTLMPNVM